MTISIDLSMIEGMRKLESTKAVTVTHLKAHLLRLLRAIERSGKPLVITRRGRPVARLVPVRPLDREPLFGRWKGTIESVGDIIEPAVAADEWEANTG